MNFIYLMLLIIFVNDVSHAQVVEQVLQDKKQVAIKKTPGAQQFLIGDIYLYTFADGSQCSFNVIEVKQNFALANYQSCSKSSEIKKGGSVEKSIFNTQVDSEDNKLKKIDSQNIINENKIEESWYTYWGVGTSVVDYSSTKIGKYLSEASAVEEQGGIRSLELFGFYWPSNEHKGWLKGVVLNTNSSYLSGPARGQFSAAMGYKRRLLSSQDLLSFSNYYFFRETIGSGFFIRGDIGLGSTFYDWNNPDNLSETKEEKELGLASIIGIGGSMLVGSETRILFMLTYRKALGTKLDFPVTGFSTGILF